MNRRTRRNLLNLFALVLLGFSIYLNFFSKDEPEQIRLSKASVKMVGK